MSVFTLYYTLVDVSQRGPKATKIDILVGIKQTKFVSFISTSTIYTYTSINQATFALYLCLLDSHTVYAREIADYALQPWATTTNYPLLQELGVYEVGKEEREAVVVNGGARVHPFSREIMRLVDASFATAMHR